MAQKRTNTTSSKTKSVSKKKPNKKQSVWRSKLVPVLIIVAVLGAFGIWKLIDSSATVKNGNLAYLNGSKLVQFDSASKTLTETKPKKDISLWNPQYSPDRSMIAFRAHSKKGFQYIAIYSVAEKKFYYKKLPDVLNILSVDWFPHNNRILVSLSYPNGKTKLKTFGTAKIAFKEVSVKSFKKSQKFIGAVPLGDHQSVVYAANGKFYHLNLSDKTSKQIYEGPITLAASNFAAVPGTKDKFTYSVYGGKSKRTSVYGVTVGSAPQKLYTTEAGQSLRGLDWSHDGKILALELVKYVDVAHEKVDKLDYRVITVDTSAKATKLMLAFTPDTYCGGKGAGPVAINPTATPIQWSRDSKYIAAALPSCVINGSSSTNTGKIAIISMYDGSVVNAPKSDMVYTLAW